MFMKGVSLIKNNIVKELEMNYLYKMSNIPKAKQRQLLLTPESVDIPMFEKLKEYKDDIYNFVNKGIQLYIFSYGFGNGKTSWSIKLLQAYFDEVWEGNGLRQRGLFIHVPTFLTKLKSIISKPDETFSELINNLHEIDVVVWDDIASTKLSDYDYNILLTYIDQRHLEGKCNIYTGNLDYNEMVTALGQRLTSRVWQSSRIVELKGADRRNSL